MKKIAVAALLLSGCAAFSDDPYIKWHRLKEQMAAINATEDAKCQKLTPPLHWGFEGVDGPKCVTIDPQKTTAKP